MSADPKFWDRIAKKYAARPVDDPESYELKLAKTREYLTPDSEVLEFACGTGTTAIKHAPLVKHIHATDISAEMLDIAKGKAEGIPNISFAQSSIEDLPDDNQYDIILGMSILHLVEDVPAVLAKVNRLLKPGGYFISSTTCMNDAAPWLKYLTPILQPFGKVPHLSWFRRNELEDMMAQAGFMLDYILQPTPKKAVFIVAGKRG